jgi:hypothetical protein
MMRTAAVGRSSSSSSSSNYQIKQWVDECKQTVWMLLPLTEHASGTMLWTHKQT